nr:PCRF domain-containing protein [Synergistales bacterium]
MYWRDCIHHLKKCRTVFDLEKDREKVTELEKRVSAPEFWKLEDAQSITRELAALRTKIEEFQEIENEIADLDTLAEILNEENDPELQEEFEDRADILREKLEVEKLALLLKDEHDEANAIVTVHAGAGGLDSQDWAEMLYRMYLRWSEKRGYRVKVLDLLQDEEAGIKSVTFLVEGLNSHGFLKSERGVHRLVRISPFDTAKRRHTSFAS